jgi:hypothetical protein
MSSKKRESFCFGACLAYMLLTTAFHVSDSKSANTSKGSILDSYRIVFPKLQFINMPLGICRNRGTFRNHSTCI